MIRFGVAKVNNFLTTKECLVDFGTPGLYGVLGPNGAGKSGLYLETLLYPLFGITERFGTERDQIVNRFLGKDCHIHLPFRVEEMSVVIDAYRKHTKFKDELFLTIDGKDARGRTNAHTWGKIEKLLDMDSVSFTNTVVFGQSVAQYFSALTDSQQKAVIERIIGLSWVPKAYELSGADVKEAQLEEGKLTVKLAEMYERSGSFKKTLEEYQKKLEDFDDYKLEKIKELGLSILKLEDTSKLEELLLSKEQKMLEAEKKLEGRNELVGQNQELNNTMAEAIASIRIKTADKQKVLTKIKNLVLLGKEVTTCDVCGQVITQESVKKYDSHLIEHMNNLDLEIKGYEEVIDEINVLKLPIQDKVDFLFKVEKEYKYLNADVALHKSQLTQIQIRNAGIEEKNRGIDKRIMEVECEISPYEVLISKLEQDLATLENERNDMKKEFDVKQDEMKYHEFMVELFSNRGYKSFVIESVLPDADRFASIYSRALGGKFEISFSPTTALKGGEVREKFNVQVNNRYGSSVYYGNSNGEKRAIDSIVMFCLGDLAASRLNKRVSLLILDDVFEKLSEDVCESIIKVLRMMVTPKDKREEEFRDLPERGSIFVLTHLNQFKESFDNKFWVSRDSHGFTQIMGG
jgi:DNA repair exonuclease SbcCD ATPase subunit